MPEQVDTKRVVLSTTEASKITGFNPTYIQRLLRQERIEGFRVGTVWLAYEDSLKAFMAQPRKRGPKGPRKQSKQSQTDASPEIEEEVKDAESKEAQTT